MANYSYRKALETIGKSNNSVGWAKNRKAVPAWRSHGILWNPFETIGKTSRYIRSHWMITFPAFCRAMPNHSYRKPFKTIGKSNVSAWWAGVTTGSRCAIVGGSGCAQRGVEMPLARTQGGRQKGTNINKGSAKLITFHVICST